MTAAKLTTQVGIYEIQWITLPKGPAGQARIKTRKKGENEFGPEQEIRWRKDADGIWVQWETQTFGFDFDGTKNETGALEFKIARRGSDEVYSGIQVLRSGEENTATEGSAKKKKLRVRAQMPGKIVRVLVKAGDAVLKDQPLLVMEAMKMENEIRATANANIKEVKVSENQTVESGADLLILE